MTAAIAISTPPPVRLCSAPRFEPPYDEDAVPEPTGTVALAASAGPLDVELPLDWGRRERWLTRRATRHSTPGRRGSGQSDPSGVRPATDELTPTVRRFIDMYVEVLNIRRPVRHLRPVMTDDAFETTRLALARRGNAWWPVPAGREPVRAVPRMSDLRSPRPPMMIAARRMRCCRPVQDVAEVAVVLHRGDEVRAMGFRLERDDARWTCTALEFVG